MNVYSTVCYVPCALSTFTIVVAEEARGQAGQHWSFQPKGVDTSFMFV